MGQLFSYILVNTLFIEESLALYNKLAFTISSIAMKHQIDQRPIQTVD